MLKGISVAASVREVVLPPLMAFLVGFSLLTLGGCGGSAPDLATMVEEARAGVVRIETLSGSGSGVIFETNDEGDALILTNYHVVEDGNKVYVEVGDELTYRGAIQGYDEAIDLAVIKICCGDFQSLPFGDVSSIKPGSEVTAVGHPLDLPGAASVTRGIVSAVRSLEGFEVIQMDASINPGNSGGPLLSADGEILGINTFALTDTQGLGIALSERTVRAMLPALKGESIYASAPTPTSTPWSLPALRPTAVPVSVPVPTPRYTATPRPTSIPTLTATPRPTVTPRPTATPTPRPTRRPTATPTPTPTPTPEPLRLMDISVGDAQTCGLRLDGTPICWGHGTGTGAENPPEGEKFTSISSGLWLTCALRPDGTPVCWGWGTTQWDGWARYGGNLFPEGEKFASLSTGQAHVCALRTDGSPHCWGWNKDDEATPPKGEKFAAISSGWDHTCGLRLSGTVVCWGGWLTRGFVVQPPKNEKFVVINNYCGLKADGTAVCWGWDSRSEPPWEPLLVGEKFTLLSTGIGGLPCGMREDGSRVCWGEFQRGSPGGDLDKRWIRPPRDQNFISISVGSYAACGLKPDGTPVCWDRNNSGEAEPPSY